MDIIGLVESQTVTYTLRKLFSAAREKEYFTDAELKKLNLAIDLRNFVVHAYWDKHARLLAKREGRDWLADDLYAAQKQLHEANGIVTSLCDRYFAEYGLNVESLKEIANSMWEGGNDPPEEMLH